jgi:GNAT superfamily N-acetyltransferase
MKIRFATEHDLYRIAEMTRDLTHHIGAFEWKVENHLRHIKRRFASARYIYLVAVEGKVIVGYIGAELKSKRTAYLMKGYVEPSHRRKGVMRRLEDSNNSLQQRRGISYDSVSSC